MKQTGINFVLAAMLLKSSSTAPIGHFVSTIPFRNIYFENTGQIQAEYVSASFLATKTTNEDSHNLEPLRHRSRRYILQGSKWRAKKLTYKISKYPKKLHSKDVDKEIARAFSVWSNVTNLSFAQCRGKTNIEIKFEEGKHGDVRAFDGPGGVFAHAFFPRFGGDVHFDASEKWAVNSRGSNLFPVAVHEIGHSLGLEHSEVEGAIMAPVYYTHGSLLKLHDDDVQGIQALYGKKDISQ